MEKALVRLVLVLLGTVQMAMGAALPEVNVFVTGNFLAGEPRTSGEFTVVKNMEVDLRVRVAFSGTAKRDADYTVGNTVATNVVFMSRTNASRAISISIIDDIRPETNETVRIMILPDPTYVVGPFSSATITLKENDTVGPVNLLPTVILKAPPELTAVPTNVTLSVTGSDVDGDVVTFEFFDNHKSLGVVPADMLSSSNSLATLAWTNIPPGTHEVFAVGVDNRGGSDRSEAYTFTVGDFINPMIAGSLRAWITKPTNLVATWFDSLKRTNAAVMEFAVPATAATQQGKLRFNIGGGLLSSYPVSIYAYEGDGNITQEDLSAPLDLVAAVPLIPNAAVPFEVDVTSLLPRFAGKILGVQFRLDPFVVGISSQGVAQTFTNLALVLFDPPAVTVQPRVQFINIPKYSTVVQTNSLPIDVEIFDPENAIGKWESLGDGAIITNNPAANFSAGTNRFTVRWPNLALGTHVFAVRVVRANGESFITEEHSILVVAPTEPLVDIVTLGSGGSSGSFYVIDAAGRAHVWGLNNAGQLGLGFAEASTGIGVTVPTTLVVSNGLRFRQIASSGDRAMALMEDGSVYSWGASIYSWESNSNKPALKYVDYTVQKIRKIGLSDTANVFMDQDGKLFAQGLLSLNASGTWHDFAVANDRAIFSRDSFLYTSTYGGVFIEGSLASVSSYAVTETFALAISSYNHQLYAWGDNSDGQLPFTGTGDMFYPRVADPVPGVEGWKKVAAVTNATFAIDSKGRLFSWGKGHLGTDTPIRNKPTLVKFPEPVVCIDVAVTTKIVMALTDRGELYAWGAAFPGIWEDMKAVEAKFPERVRGLPNLLDPNASADLASFRRRPTISGTNLQTQIVGALGTPLSIEGSADLQNWTVITNVPNTDGLETLTLPMDGAHRFFRVGAMRQ